MSQGKSTPVSIILKKMSFFPPMFNQFIELKSQHIIKFITPLVRMKCQNCGAYKRKRDCPPYTPSIKKIKEIIDRYDRFYLFIWQSDGSVAWRKGFDKSKLVKKRERGLKGCAIGMQVSIMNIMRDLVDTFKERNIKVRAWVAGPCHKCRICNVGGPCKKGGSLPSMEAWGMDVYGLFGQLGVKYEHPVKSYITCASLLGIRKKG